MPDGNDPVATIWAMVSMALPIIGLIAKQLGHGKVARVLAALADDEPEPEPPKPTPRKRTPAKATTPARKAPAKRTTKAPAKAPAKTTRPRKTTQKKPSP